jgi:hypothetical protein
MTSLAFEIDFDHYRFGLRLEISCIQDYYRSQIRHGCKAFKMQNLTQQAPGLPYGAKEWESMHLICIGSCLSGRNRID